MLSCLVFSTTDRCTIECPHCGAEANPRNRQRLSLEFMKRTIDEMADFGHLELVVFTGGEPFVMGEDLLSALRYCNLHRLKTRIVTNAYWARSPAAAERVLTIHMDAGLTELNISCDDYHQREIPAASVRYANDAARRIGLPCLIGHKVMKDCKITEAVLSDVVGAPLQRYVYGADNPTNDVYLSSYTVPLAPEMHLIPDDEILFPETDDWKAPCTAVMESVVVTPFHDVSICCGMIPRSVPEVLVGDLDSNGLGSILLAADADLMVNWLALEGPYGLMKFIQVHSPEIEFRQRYVGPCHLCSEILTRPECRDVLARHASERQVEIAIKRRVCNFMRRERLVDERAATPTAVLGHDTAAANPDHSLDSMR